MHIPHRLMITSSGKIMAAAVFLKPSWKLCFQESINAAAAGRMSDHLAEHPLLPSPKAFLIIHLADKVQSFMLLLWRASCLMTLFMPSHCCTSPSRKWRRANDHPYKCTPQRPVATASSKSGRKRRINLAVLTSVTPLSAAWATPWTVALH
jgi:hypothetical protein